MSPATRIILHVDMDAFYAAVETLERPELTEYPLVIGADPRGGKSRGVVSTANYAARKFGIHSAMPIARAYKLCPEAVFIRPSFDKYRPASDDVMEVLRTNADILEQVGMDEAYLDVTAACKGDWNRVSSFCRALQAAVRRATGLSCSVGAARAKSIAKIASDSRKPHGVQVVQPAEEQQFLAPLPVRLINGCGPKMTATLRDNGYKTIRDIATADRNYIEARFGKHGAWVWRVANGQDDREVHAERGPAKSRSNERTYGRDTRDTDEIKSHAHRLLAGLIDRKSDRRAFATITAKIRYHDFSTLTRAHTLSIPLSPDDAITSSIAESTLQALLAPLLDGRAVRLIGVRLSNFSEPTGQQSLQAYIGRQAKSAVPKWTA